MLKRVDAAEPSSEPSSPGLHSSDEEDEDPNTKRERAERRRTDARDERRRRHPYPIRGGGAKTFQSGSNYVHLGPGTYSGRGVDELGGIEADNSVTLPFRNQEPRSIDFRHVNHDPPRPWRSTSQSPTTHDLLPSPLSLSLSLFHRPTHLTPPHAHQCHWLKPYLNIGAVHGP